MRRAMIVSIAAAVVVSATTVLSLSAAARTRSVEPPVQAGSPWPQMRHDRRNTGQTAIVARYAGDAPWKFRTGRGIFASPVIDADGTVYVGSADSNFYALSPRGALRWKYTTGNLIDSAAVIGARDSRLGASPITFGSGDEKLYQLRAGADIPARQRVAWTYTPTDHPANTQLVNWWEGNAELGPDGTIYAGNTGGGAYAINRDGTRKWVYQTGNSVWTDAAIGDDGATYWGSLDLSVYALDANGRLRWKAGTLGFVVSSPALANDGTLYVGSFDGKVYALDATTGATKWTFATGDNVYSSPALDEDSQGKLVAVDVASADGSVYSIDPAGHLRWKYDTGDVVRSSPVIGRAPANETASIVYVGSGNGSVFALDAASGKRRWSYETTLTDPVLHDRNDLNSSPALGNTGLYIGSEDGYLRYIPYDYCLHRKDRRCATGAGSQFAADGAHVYPVSAGGSTDVSDRVQPIATSTVLPLRLVARVGGATVDASMATGQSTGPVVTADPTFDFTTQLSGDGHFIFVHPTGFLSPGTTYRVRIAGAATPIGGGAPLRFDDAIRYRVAKSAGTFPLRSSGGASRVLNLRRLAIPLPSFLPSVNQIGFDSYDWLVGPVSVSKPDGRGEGSMLLWVVGARRDPRDRLVPDSNRSFAFPLAGRYRGDSFAVSAKPVQLTFSFGAVPMDRFELRGRVAPDLSVLPGANLYGEVICDQVPTYGPFLRSATRLCNAENRLVASGTFLAGRSPAGVVLDQRSAVVSRHSVSLRRPTPTDDGSVTATFAVHEDGGAISAKQHVPSILLVDAATGLPIPIDYRASTETTTDDRGAITGVQLSIPKGTALPAHVTAYVLIDVLPIITAKL